MSRRLILQQACCQSLVLFPLLRSLRFYVLFHFPMMVLFIIPSWYHYTIDHSGLYRGEICSHLTLLRASIAADPSLHGGRLLPGAADGEHNSAEKFRAGGVVIIGKRERISGDCSGVKTEVRSGLHGKDPPILAFCAGVGRRRFGSAGMEEICHRIHRVGDQAMEVRSGSRGRDQPLPSSNWKSGDRGPVRLAWRRTAIAFTALAIGRVEGDLIDDDWRENGRWRSEVRRE
ncbi:hypothetical protein TIFTF001_026705 [Ficus carica]|uniref:Uncharacterized protein n=1 Tax=Ficus carica TaxID=3494 RepID=A0AA88DLL1_FICCA|nr:hypothetical protein TIFTF001_026705 [Ficus carica]